MLRVGRRLAGLTPGDSHDAARLVACSWDQGKVSPASMGSGEWSTQLAADTMAMGLVLALAAAARCAADTSRRSCGTEDRAGGSWARAPAMADACTAPVSVSGSCLRAMSKLLYDVAAGPEWVDETLSTGLWAAASAGVGAKETGADNHGERPPMLIRDNASEALACDMRREYSGSRPAPVNRMGDSGDNDIRRGRGLGAVLALGAWALEPEPELPVLCDEPEPSAGGSGPGRAPAAVCGTPWATPWRQKNGAMSLSAGKSSMGGGSGPGPGAPERWLARLDAEAVENPALEASLSESRVSS